MDKSDSNLDCFIMTVAARLRDAFVPGIVWSGAPGLLCDTDYSCDESDPHSIATTTEMTTSTEMTTTTPRSTTTTPRSTTTKRALIISFSKTNATTIQTSKFQSSTKESELKLM